MSRGQRGRPMTTQEFNGLRQNVARSAESGVPRTSAIHEHLARLGDLKPEIAGIDALSFIAEIDSSGNITQPVQQNLPGGYYCELFGIRGLMQAPSTDPELAALTRFNIRDKERSGDIFSNDQEMGFLLTTEGGGEPMYWDRGLYVFDPGAAVEAKFTINSDASDTVYDYSTQSSASKRWGVQLLFNLYSV